MKKRLLRKMVNKNRNKLVDFVKGIFNASCGGSKAIIKEVALVVRPSDVAIIYRSELDFISRCILDRTNIETGGQLFGFWTGNGVPVVLYAIGPGPNANHQVAFFNQDVNYLVTVGKKLISKYGLQHIGEWHSHHQLGLAYPSGHDASTMVNSIKKRNIGKFLLSIGNCTDTESTLNAFNFTQSTGYNYVHSDWEIKEVDSPFRVMIDADPELSAIIRNPETKVARHGKLKTVTKSIEFVSPAYAEDYWLKDKSNNLGLKSIMDYFSERSASGRCAAQLDELGQAHLSLTDGGENVRVVFVAGFPELPPIVSFNGIERSGVDVSWDYTDDIAKSFVRYYEKLKGIKS